MADKQVEKGDDSHPPTPSTGQDAPGGGVQQEETAYSESDFFFSAEFSKHQSGENGDHHLSLVLLTF